MRRLVGILSVWLLSSAGMVRAEVPTYNKDIAPILWKNCAGCHRPGEIGPFSLLTYKDAAKRASFLAEDHREPADAAVEARARVSARFMTSVA